MAGVKFQRNTLTGLTGNKAGDFNQGQRFMVEIAGISNGGFHKFEGLTSESEDVHYGDSDDKRQHVRAGPEKPGTVTLYRNWSSNDELFNWFTKGTYEGKVQRQSISFVWLTDDGGESRRINLHECWPLSWAITGMNAKSSGHIVEVIEVSYEHMQHV